MSDIIIRVIEKRLLSRIHVLKAQLDESRPLPKSVLARLREQINLEWIYNSNAIEGSTLTLRETQLILEHGFTIGGKSLREHFEVINHQTAIHFVEQLAAQHSRLTTHQIRQLHQQLQQLVLKNIDDENAGQYRQIVVRIAGAKHVPAEPWQVPALMDDLVRWIAGRDSVALHPIERAAQVHHRFVAIHPFVDGNGRTGRLLLNLLLFKDGYPPTVIEKINRRQYYKVLGDADAGNLRPLTNFVARACERSLQMYVEAGRVMTRQPAKKERWLPLSEAAQDSLYTQEYLSLLARLGRLKAKKQGRNWLTTQAAIQEYRASTRR